jgi:tetraprenyl-beta-curcumene synthase
VALGGAASRELVWGLRWVSHEVAGWRAIAIAIPDEALREDAISALDSKRANIDGAALFWTLPRTRSRELLRLLVAYEILADYLDCASERAASAGVRNGLRLHRALIEALDPTLAVSDYYLSHPSREDGGYLRALVECCRSTVVRLPSYPQAQPFAVRAAHLAQVLALNHEPDASIRDRELQRWACRHFPQSQGLAWFEWTGGASAWLTVLALLASAADVGRDAQDARATYGAYLPWMSLAGTMLDSYVDTAEDNATGAHSYIGHYPGDRAAIARVSEVLANAFDCAARLPDGERHLVLGSCMVAMYLSKDGTRTAHALEGTRCIARAAGPLAQVLIPVLRAWRIAYGQKADGAAKPTVPRPARLPPSAPLPSAFQTLGFWRDPHSYLAWCRRRYGSRFTIRSVGMPPLVFTADPKDISAIVRAPADVLHPGAGAAVIAPLVGEDSFMLAEEDIHLAGRRAIMPAFQHQRVIDHTEMVNDTVDGEVALWPRDTPFALHPFLRALTLRVILQTIFGREHQRQRELHRRLLAMLSVTGSLALQEAQLRRVAPWRRFWRSFLAERIAVDEIIDGLIADEAHAEARDSGLLGMLLDSASDKHGEADPRQVRDDLMSVILAGHETTASELAWAFQLLAHNPRVAASLVDSLHAGEDRYLKATVQEVLRHRPVFLFTIPRVVRRPFELAGETFRAPVHLVGCIHLMQHDPTLYEEPERFRPERFLADHPQGDVWMPWGGGRKRCPGHHLALLEMQLVLRTVLLGFDVLPVGRRVETARWRSVIVTPGHGSRVVLRPRAAAPIATTSGLPPFFSTPFL